MNFTTVKLSVISAAALALSASQSFAQTNLKVSVKVPFDFAAGTTRLPAGTYTFSEERPGIMYINSPELHRGIVLLTNPEPGGPTSETASVKFDKVNGQYALTQVNVIGEPSHRLIRLEEKSGLFTSRLGVTNATAKSLR